jgi:hypothetical protein
MNYQYESFSVYTNGAFQSGYLQTLHWGFETRRSEARRWQSESIPGPSFRQSRGHGEQKPGNIMVLPSGKLT